MSGGHYDYNYWKILELREQIERDIESGRIDDPLAVAVARKLMRELEKIGERAKAFEWYMSGDTTITSVLKLYRRGKQ